MQAAAQLIPDATAANHAQGEQGHVQRLAVAGRTLLNQPAQVDRHGKLG